MNIQLLQFREHIIKAIRNYLYDQGFHEVVVPVLQNTIPLEPNIYPFTTASFFLPTSPESACIKYLAGGGGNCFAISPTFRKYEQTSPIHTQEFLMLEWYREQSTIKEIMDETRRLISHVADFPFPELKMPQFREWSIYSMSELFQQYIGVSLPNLIDDKKMIAFAKDKSYITKGASWEQLFNQIFLNEIEPHLGKDPVFVTDYPSKISPFCKPKKDNPDFSERFELYVNNIEIANGNAQNADVDCIRKVFIEEQKLRKTKGIASPPIDTSFLLATEKLKTKRVCGVGLGIDRLVMILVGTTNIEELKI